MYVMHFIYFHLQLSSLILLSLELKPLFSASSPAHFHVFLCETHQDN